MVSYTQSCVLSIPYFPDPSATVQLADNGQLKFSTVCSASHIASPFARSAVVYSTCSEMLTLAMEWSQGCSPFFTLSCSFQRSGVMMKTKLFNHNIRSFLGKDTNCFAKFCRISRYPSSVASVFYEMPEAL